MNKITTYQQMLDKKQVLEIELASKKIIMKREFEEVKTKLMPLRKIANTAGDLINRDRTNPLLNVGLDVGVNFLLKNIMFRKAGLFARLLVPSLVKNYLSNNIQKKENLLTKIVNLFGRRADHYPEINGENNIHSEAHDFRIGEKFPQ